MAFSPSQRYGQDTAPRISTTAVVMSEATELAPVPSYQTIVPFLPISTSTTGTSLTTSSSSSATPQWKNFPDRLDLYAYQGDDVQIPLYFQDAADPTLDLSGYDWKAQTRVLHRYWSTLVSDFTINATYSPPVVGPPAVASYTLVTLFLPRMHNGVIGTYEWDLRSLSPFVGPIYPKPDDIDAADWPPTDMLKTWLFGHFHIVPRVTSTDHLPIPATAVQAGSLVIVTPAGLFGPNGRVP